MFYKYKIIFCKQNLCDMTLIMIHLKPKLNSMHTSKSGLGQNKCTPFVCYTPGDLHACANTSENQNFK